MYFFPPLFLLKQMKVLKSNDYGKNHSTRRFGESRKGGVPVT
jgi:hypothetical protein